MDIVGDRFKKNDIYIPEVFCLPRLSAQPTIPQPHCFKQFSSRFRADSLVHRMPPVFGNILLRQLPDSGNRKRDQYGGNL